MGDAATRQSKRRRGEPGERRCLVRGTPEDRASLIRLVFDPEDTLIADLKENLPGRGAWVTNDRALIEGAVSAGKLPGLLSRSLRRPVTAQSIPDDLAANIDALMTAAVLNRLGLARRTGALALGLETVERLVRSGYVTCIVIANDAASDSRRKIRQALHAVDADMTVPIIDLFDREQLSMALGVGNGVIAALNTKSQDKRHFAALYRGFRSDLARLMTYRGLTPNVGDSADFDCHVEETG